MWPSPPTPTTTARAGAQQRQRLADHVHDGQAGVRVRGDVGRFQAGRKREDTAVGGREQFGEAAVAGEAGEGQAPGAAHVVADAARRAEAARQLGVADDGVAHGDVLDLRADVVHPAGVLVPSVIGSSVGTAGANHPSRMCRSVRHSPAPPTRTTTSWGPRTTGPATSSSRGCCE
jgi:hypothetical protein